MPTPASFSDYLRALPWTDYLETHTERYLQTWTTFEDVLSKSERILELGELSPISDFCRDHWGKSVATYSQDLRFPFDLTSNSFDLVLSLEVVEHINEPLRSDSSIGEIAMFQSAGAKNMFRECMRILKNGGALALTTPNASSIDVLGNVLSKRSTFLYEPHVREYTKNEIVALATDVSLRLKEYRTFFAWNAREGLNRETLMQQLSAQGYDMADRGDDAAYLFLK